ncbi:ketopantoate reductase family protein [Abyssalbus ytuae]|uniref:2-dehydropantoate 2-reductase n=1 Tax=Abyssalbus ytuae TaxID=2926907 RepID=A0A9E6ZW21_9FLAO|nr:2-dehydropantoate 2-reductase [Abyssalbus ytuae]UOB16267.1 2-dehydropantoate 2-reductase [Abyssalbus ytuae]
MKIVVFGIGGVGGYFGGKIARTSNEVIFIARGEHLKTIREKGLAVKSIDGDFTIKPSLATSTVSDVGKADLILVCTKSWQVEEAAQAILPLLHDHTMVLPLQNGADNEEKLMKVIEKKHVLAGMCKIYSKVEAPGVINHFAFTPEIVFGEMNNEKTERIKKLDKIFKSAGFLSTIPDDIHVEIWKKYIFIATVSGMGALTRVPIKIMADDDYLNNLMRQAVFEIYQVARAKGVNLNEQITDGVMKFIEAQSAGSTASTQRDIMEGRPSELENFNGYVVKEGERLGIETPVNKIIYRLLLPQEKIARGL